VSVAVAIWGAVHGMGGSAWEVAQFARNSGAEPEHSLSHRHARLSTESRHEDGGGDGEDHLTLTAGTTTSALPGWGGETKHGITCILDACSQRCAFFCEWVAHRCWQ
jgi:hypothetical protein